MANVMRGVGNEGVRDILYSRPKRLLEDYHEEVFGDEGIARNFSERFRERAKAKIDRLKSSRAIRAASATFRKLRNRGRLDRIECLLDVGALQHAPPRMQSLIMANPNVRRRWQKRTLAGYENGYNLRADQRNSIKHSHSTYRMIMDGLVQEDEGKHVSHTYALTQAEKDNLSYKDKAEIRQTWARVDEMLWENLEDPTSEYNAML
ncbi:hypothetical protein pVa21_210 [Vibrio phage pVa-21]|nr:hypothetical protein pVa21_210 [Vibrio phage pVa-21]